MVVYFFLQMKIFPNGTLPPEATFPEGSPYKLVYVYE